MKKVIFFETREELRELTGLPGDNHDIALWDAGFNLDDWDFGFVSDEKWTEGWWNNEAPYYEFWLLNRMEAHCVGYRETEYNGRWYYMVYHA